MSYMLHYDQIPPFIDCKSFRLMKIKSSCVKSVFKLSQKTSSPFFKQNVKYITMIWNEIDYMIYK